MLDTPTRMDDYLAELRVGLRSLPQGQVREIVEEIRSFILDAVGSGGEMTEANITAALQRLGPASALAANYVSENLFPQAERRRSPFILLKSTFYWASLSVWGLFVLLGSLIGYSLSACFAFCALAKPINPHRVGLWRIGGDEFSLHLGFGPPPMPLAGHEVLGWSIIPLGLVAATGLVLLTTEIGLHTIRCFQRQRMHFVR